MKGKQGKEEATPLFKKREPTKIIIDLEMRENFRTEVDVKKVQLALAVVLEQAYFRQSELDEALQIIEERVEEGGYNINFNSADMSNQGYDPFGFYAHDEDEDGEPIDGWTNY